MALRLNLYYFARFSKSIVKGGISPPCMVPLKNVVIEFKSDKYIGNTFSKYVK